MMTGKKILFALRFWQEKITSTESEWRGEIKAVDTNEVRYFRDWRTMVDFLIEVLSGWKGQPAAHAGSLADSGAPNSSTVDLHRLPVRHSVHRSQVKRHASGLPKRRHVDPDAGPAGPGDQPRPGTR